MNVQLNPALNRVFEVSFLDNKGEIRFFISSGVNLDYATEKVWDSLSAPDGIFCGAKGWMHVETKELSEVTP